MQTIVIVFVCLHISTSHLTAQGIIDIRENVQPNYAQGVVSEDIYSEPLDTVITEELMPTTASQLNPFVINLNTVEYEQLVRDVFVDTGRQVSLDAMQFIQGVDEYRARIVLQVQQTKELIRAIERLLFNQYKGALPATHTDFLKDMWRRVDMLHTNTFIILEEDTFLENSLRDEYEVYTSFIGKFFSRSTLNRQRSALMNIRSESLKLQNLLQDFYNTIRPQL